MKFNDSFIITKINKIRKCKMKEVNTKVNLVASNSNELVFYEARKFRR